LPHYYYPVIPKDTENPSDGNTALTTEK